MRSIDSTNQPKLDCAYILRKVPTPRANPTIASCSYEAAHDFSCSRTGDAQQGVADSVDRLRATLDVYSRKWFHACIFGYQFVRSRDVDLQGWVSSGIMGTRMPTEDG